MDPLAALTARLEQEGFAVEERPPSASFGDRLITLAVADPSEPMPLDAQAAYVGERLDALRAAAVDPSLRDRLSEMAIARADLWFG